MATGVEVREVQVEKNSNVAKMGIIGGGYETMRYAWPKIEVVFSIRNADDTTLQGFTDPLVVGMGPHRVWARLLTRHPVDLMLIERGLYGKPKTDLRGDAWEEMVKRTTSTKRPRIIMESWRSDAQLWRFGPMSKATTTRWTELGYNVHCRTINATSVGGAIDHDRLLVIRFRKHTGFRWDWESWETMQQSLDP